MSFLLDYPCRTGAPHQAMQRRRSVDATCRPASTPSPRDVASDARWARINLKCAVCVTIAQFSIPGVHIYQTSFYTQCIICFWKALGAAPRRSDRWRTAPGASLRSDFRGKHGIRTHQAADRDARHHGLRHLRHRPQPDGRHARPAVHHDGDERRRVPGPMADHRIHAGQRHHDPRHRLPHRQALDQDPLHRVDGHLRAWQPHGGHRPQLRRAAGRPSAASRGRRHPHADGHDGADAHLPRRAPRLGHGHASASSSRSPPPSAPASPVSSSTPTDGASCSTPSPF